MFILRKEWLSITLLALVFSFCLGPGFAQNLVPNSSFSETDSLGFLHWQKLENKSIYRYESDKGKDMAAFLVADVQGKVPNSTTYFGMGEHLMAVKLKEPLAAGAFYKLSLKARQADSSQLIISKLGVYFADKKGPDILLNLSEVNSSDEWWVLKDFYMARGGEQFLYIGKMSDIGIETAWNKKFKREKYQSQWHLNKAGYKHMACYTIDDVVLEKIPIKPSFILEKEFVPENILFETAKADLSEKAESYLLLLASFLRNHPEIEISIAGFADERGGSEYNIQLSKNRAISVANLLLLHGVAKKRIQLQWHGSEKAGKNESEYYLDRKIVLKLTSI